MRSSFKRGIKDSIPLCLGVIAVGVSYGFLGVRSGISAWQTVAMSALVMAGASQIMAVGMIAESASAIAIVIATFLINLRHFVMSSYVMNRLRGEKTGEKLLSAFALCDETFALFSMSEDADNHFLLGANTALYISWITSSALGCFLSGLLPEIVSKSFGIAFYAAFIAILLPKVKANIKLILLVIITALMNWGLRLVLAPSWALIISMLSGAAAGVAIVDD